MFKSLYQKLFPPKPQQPVPYDIATYGYLPYTEKLIANAIPVYKDPSDTELRRAYYRQFSSPDQQDAIYLNVMSDIEARYRREHEGVHVDQRQFEKIPPYYAFEPRHFIAYERFTELEAHLRESYAVLHDYRHGLITLDQIFENGLVETPLCELLPRVTDGTPVHGKQQFVASMQKARQKDDFPAEKNILAECMIQLSCDAVSMRSITETPLQTLQDVNTTVADVHKGFSLLTRHLAFEELGIDPHNSFTAKFYLQNATDLLNRDGIDYFEHVPLSAQQQMMDNLFSFTPAELQRINELTPDIRAFGQ